MPETTTPSNETLAEVGGNGAPPEDAAGSDSPWRLLLAKAQNFAATPVSAMGLPNPPKKKLLEGDTEKNLPFDIDNVTFSVFGAANISVFNAVSDKDGDGYLGDPAQAGGDSGNGNGQAELAIGRLVDFQPGNAWLKYDLEAGVKTDIDLGDAGFDFKAEGGVRHSAYLRHKANETVLQALTWDLTHPKFIFTRSDLQDLKPGELVALTAHGKLGATLQFKWSDIFTSGLNVLGRLIPVAGEVFNIQVGASASAKLDISVSDVFQVAIARVDANTFRIGVKKADGSSLAVGITAAVAAKFADENAVQKVLQQTVDGLLAAPLQEVRKVLEPITRLDELDDEQKVLVEHVLKRLGLDGLVEEATELTKELDAFEKKVAQTLKEIATSKAELSFAYDYKRVEAQDQVLVARLSASALDIYHQDLVRGRLQNLLTAANDGNDNSLELERFLFQKSLEVSRSWGFSLAFGKWFQASGKDKKKLENVKRRNAAGDIQRTFLGIRGYEGKWVEDKLAWDVDFNAEMIKYFPPPVKASNFQYSLDLQMMNQQRKVKDDEIPALVDRAVIWGSLPPNRIGEIADRIEALVADLRNDITFDYKLSLDPVAFKAVLGELARSDAKAFGRALGEAMPWVDRSRLTASARRGLFGDLWRHYLVDDSMTPKRLANQAVATLERNGHGQLAFWEAKWMALRTTTLGGLADINRDTRDNWNDFVVGATILRDAIASGGPHEDIRQAFQKMQELWSQSHHVWALGVYLRDLVNRRPELGKHVGRFFSITYKAKNGKLMIEHFGTSRPKVEAED